MALTAGTRLGSYEVIAQLGVGGMGEVYRASDTRLKRDVAIKILPPSVALDQDRLARFQREAEVLASLNHPNIAHLLGLEEADGVKALIMELVEGSTLAERIAQGGPLSLDEALAVARQIAEGLEAAHEQSIIHRDLKPANIALRPDGTVKILDFGLAKAVEPVAGIPASGVQGPTITSPAMTQLGVMLGTAAYMSPEQARGKAVDRRADIWAFGCVLFEMLTGRRAFDDEDVSMTLSKVLQREPDFDLLPPSVPSRVRVVLRLCLQKDLRQRARSIGDIRLALEGAFESVSSPAARPPVTLGRRVATGAAAALAIAAATGTITWLATRPDPPPVSQLIAAPQAGPAALSIVTGGVSMTMTPDGSQVVYVGNNGTQLFVRSIDTLEPKPIYTGSPRQPFVSPDGAWIGFVEPSRVLKKIRITGGPAISLTTLDGELRGATWAPPDAIILATTSPVSGLQRLGATDGKVSVITTADASKGEYDHLWPELLPGGRAVLFTITAPAESATMTGTLDTSQVAVRNLETGTTTIVVPGATHARYSPTGHLIYGQGEEVRAIAFDLASLTAVGTGVSVARDTAISIFGAVDAAAGRNGSLAYITGGADPRRFRVTVVWVSRDGRETPVGVEPGAYRLARLSPDDSRIAFYITNQGLDIWIWEFAARTLKRIWPGRAADLFPVWTLDNRLIFSSEREGSRNLFWGAADGSGSLAKLFSSPHMLNASALTPDGSKLIYTEVSPQTNEDVMEVELTPPYRTRALVNRSPSERNAVVSPNGRWLAYEANESDSFQIYVRPYPNTDSEHRQVSTSGGTSPLWTRDGKGLIFASPQGALMQVDVSEGPTWKASQPYRVVTEGYATVPNALRTSTPMRTYDIGRDGRFLLLKQAPGTDAPVAPPMLVVEQNFSRRLEQLLRSR